MKEDKVIKRMQLARTGSFGADGASITLQNLQDVVDTFDGKGPVSIGHQMAKQDWFPQFGNVRTFWPRRSTADSTLGGPCPSQHVRQTENDTCITWRSSERPLPRSGIC